MLKHGTANTIISYRDLIKFHYIRVPSWRVLDGLPKIKLSNCTAVNYFSSPGMHTDLKKFAQNVSCRLTGNCFLIWWYSGWWQELALSHWLCRYVSIVSYIPTQPDSRTCVSSAQLTVTTESTPWHFFKIIHTLSTLNQIHRLLVCLTKMHYCSTDNTETSFK
jgi:hypothetical protein